VGNIIRIFPSNKSVELSPNCGCKECSLGLKVLRVARNLTAKFIAANTNMAPLMTHTSFCRLTSLAFVLICLAVFSLGCASKAAPPPAPPPVPVTAAAVVEKNVPVQVRAIGSVEAYSNVAVKTQVTGELTGVYFKEGDDVKKGQLLFTLDKRGLEATLKQAEASLVRDKAQAANARTQAKRYEALFGAGVVSKEQFDQIQSTAEALDAAVAADQAAVENAKVQLIYCTIYSPINGHAGTLMIHQGNMIKANDTPFLVSLNQVEPIYVTFMVPEQYLAEIKRYSAKGKLAVQAVIPNEARGPAVGKLSFIDNTVDTATGTIRLKGEFVNADRRLWPGQFVDVILTLADQPNAIVIPSQAVQNGQQGPFVFVVKPDMTVEARPVTVNRSSDGQAVIGKGLAQGEQIVTDGQLRLIPGSKVELKQGDSPATAVKTTADRAKGE
jgi:membrane fusion protein, multidrug efflux system